MTRRALIVAAAALASCGRNPADLPPSAEARRPAVVYPDSAGATIPVNIAPLNFKVLEHGRDFRLRVSGASGRPIDLATSSGSFDLPSDAWRELLRANAGGVLRTDVYVDGDRGWTHFDTVSNPVSADEIDPYVVYRYIPPIYDKWDRISLRQRDLRSFDERVVFDNERSLAPDGKSAANACVNCHTFQNHRTERMLLHARPSRAGMIPAMIVVRDGRAEKIDTRAGGRGVASYPAWHPNGKLIAFSRNSLLQIFHTAGDDVREVVDRDSDLGLYDLETGKTYTVPQISRPDRLETWPAWSPDGRYLYFSSAPQLSTDRKAPPPNWNTIRYDLARVSYDAAAGRWGEPETVVSASRLGRSISEPVVSPDGRWLMFTAHDHGSFPIFQPGADLYLVDLAAAAFPAPARRIDEINSDRADSYHSWSSNSRWVIFSSKREDGVFTRFYIAHARADGTFGKPFILPQRDPDFYRHCVMAFNRPELVVEPIRVSAAELTRAMNSEVGTAAQGSSAEEPYRPSK